MPGAAEYRTEHVAQTPAGWHVRMKAPGAQSGHLIGIAFPPGRRRKGSGRLIEILHPADEKNPRCEISKQARENPGELLIFGNPHGRRVSRARAGRRAGHKFGCPCFACRHARSEAPAARGKNSKLSQQRAARERAGRIRGARLNPPQLVGEHKDVAMYFEGISYNAPSMKLRGYSTDLALQRAIDRKLKKAGAKNPGLSGSDERDLTQLWHTARIAGMNTFGERITWAAKEWDKTHPGQRMRAYKWLSTAMRGYNPAYVYFTLNGRQYRTDGQIVEGKDGQTWNRTGSLPVVLAARKEWAARSSNPKAFAGWKHFTKAEKNFLRSIHAPAPKNEEEVREYKETLRKIDEINARHRGENPVHMQVTFDRGIQKYLAYLYDPKFGNLYATGYTKKQAAKALHEEVRRVRRTGSWRNPPASKAKIRELEDRFMELSNRESQLRKQGKMYAPSGGVYSAEYSKAQDEAMAAFEAYERAKRSRNPRGRTVPEILRECDKLRAALQYRMGNPRRRNVSDIDQAVNLYTSFHGRDPKSIVEEHVSAATRLDYAALGDLEYLEVRPPVGNKNAKFFFDGDGVKLASSPDGKQLYCIGGNQDLLPCLDKDSQQKDFIDLGDAIEVQYLARKVHADFRPVSYYHQFGEINGALPRVMFDKIKKQIFFVGGEYFIDTSKGVSPGIEN